jgi:hypothetical protein
LTLQIQDLEVENNRLQQDLDGLRRAVAESTDFDSTGNKGGQAADKLMGE